MTRLPKYLTLEQAMETYETTQPWVIYVYLQTDFWVRIVGTSKIRCECCICGKQETVTLRVPRFGAIPDRGKHPARVAFLGRHEHPLQQTAPETWARPLRNPAAHNDWLDILRDVATKVQREARS